MTRTLAVDTWRAWIGREDTASDVVTSELAKRFCATLDHPASEPLAPIVPAGLHWCLAPPACPTAMLGPDGHPSRGGFLPPIPLPRRMWAGGALAFKVPLRVGDHVGRRSRIEDIVLKQGRTGPLCFVTVRHELSVGGAVAIEERQDIVYRGLEAAEPRSVGQSAPNPGSAPGWSKTVEAEPPLLFRYSALTFNGHRIHYDRRYCIEEEGYPGLVVHGPMQATLLLLLATEIRGGRPPKAFSFRSVAPLFDGAAFRLEASEQGDGLQLWTADRGMRKAMTAVATW